MKKARRSRSTPSPRQGVKSGENFRRLKYELELYQVLGSFTHKSFSMDRVFDRFLRKAMKFFNTKAGTIFSLDSETNELVFRAVQGSARKILQGLRLKVGSGIAGWVAKTGKPRLVPDVNNDPRWNREFSKMTDYPTKDILAVPLFAHSGSLVGVIELLSKLDGRGFDKGDLEHLVAISGSIGNLLENAELLSTSRRRNHQLRFLNEVSQLINSTLDSSIVRYRTIEAAMRLVQCEAGSLLLLDEQKQQLFFEVALGQRADEVRKIRLKPGEGIAGWVVMHGQPVMISDCSRDPRWTERVDQQSRFNTRDMICVPVKIKEVAIGAIQTINKRKGRFDREDLEALEILADQVAVALENARLFDELQITFLETSVALAESIELRDSYTGGHTRRVTRYAMAIGRILGMNEKELESLRMAAVLHDIGKIGVDDQVLRKPGRLEQMEFEQMKKHPGFGAEILQHIHSLSHVVPGIRSHHERSDGKGYPDGLRGQRIPLISRVIAVADTYDAMTSDRPYRKGLDKETAIREIVSCTGSQFDKTVVQSFLQAFQSGEITGNQEKVPGGDPQS